MKTLQALTLCSLQKLANTLHYGKKNMKNWKQTDDFVKYVIYVVVIKICRNVYASYRCYLFYQNP